MRHASAGILFLLLPLPTAVAAAQATTLEIPASFGGPEGNADSFDPAISDDGRITAFASLATNLVGGDTNAVMDVFVFDREKNRTRRMSIDSAGVEANLDSAEPAISGDGRHVAFTSGATNLVTGDTNNVVDVFVHDRVTDTTVRVSIATGGLQGDGKCLAPALSTTGRFVVFASDATNLVAGDTNSKTDIFLHDRDPDGNGIFDEGNGATERVNIRTNGNQARGGNSSVPSISGDGNLVAFTSGADNLIATDTNTVPDVFLRDRAAGTTVRISEDSTGVEADKQSSNPSLSRDGTKVVFDSVADNLSANDTNATTDVFLRDLTTGTVTRISVSSFGQQGNGASSGPTFGADGRFVVFTSSASTLTPGDGNSVADIFMRDLQRNLTQRVSLSANGTESLGASARPDVNADGTAIVFDNAAFDLADGDSDFVNDIFVRLLCPASATNYGNGLAGTLGVPALTATNPVIAGPLSVTLGNSAGADTPAVLFGGLDEALLPTSWGGDLLVDPILIVPLVVPAAGLVLAGSIPDAPTLCGVTFHLQVLEVDAGAPHGVSFTQGLKLLFGF